ncbi:MAG: sodium-translocating pyrophosphatase [Phycisphaerales bacterium]|nr:sodium-translocating pyrophosphatase [Phycisphaerales bacterium]
MSMQLMPTLASITDAPSAYWLAPIGGILALVMARVFQASVMKKSEGSEDMIEIAQAVRDGAMAYLTRQYKVVAGVFVLLIVFLGIMSALNLQSTWALIGVPVAGLFSGLCGWFGMKMATNASARTTHAVKDSLNEGLTVAFRSGAVMGLNVVGFALIDVSVWFFIFNQFGLVGGGITEITTIMLTFGMGASTQALFARVGGGIYTKAADVGADLVGKIEAGIPEDDARNPATIADNVGDNVGDVAGMGADLYESYYGSILATMALGAAAAMTLANGEAAGDLGLKLAVAPMALAGMGIFCSIAGIYAVKAKENANFSQLLKGLHKGVYVASALIVVCAFALLWFIFKDTGDIANFPSWWGLGLSICSGLLSGLVIAHATEYYTSYEHPPTKRIAEQALTGPATVIIAGIAEGMKSTWASLLVVVVAIIAAFSFAGGGDSFLMGLYGVGIAAVGMLSTLGITLATDAYGPIADNAGGNAEMTGQEPIVRERTDMLDSLGNTTAATGKGFAIGSAALTAMALFAAYIQIVQVQIGTQAVNFYGDGSKYVQYADSPIGFAVHQGYGKFAVVTPGADGQMVDGGMLLDVVDDNGRHSTKIPGLKPRDKGVEFVLTASHDSRYEIAGEGWKATMASTQRGRVKDVLAFYDVTLANPKLLGGMFIGVLLAFLFCALTMNAVGRAAYVMMGECRRQFGLIRQALRNGGMSEEDVADPNNWPMKGVDLDGHHYPDYAECVAISTTSAQKEMVMPSILAISIPILVGLTLSVAGVMGMLVGGLTSGFALAVFMANAGGAWDNAKKLIESYGAITAQDMIDGTGNSVKVPDSVRSSIMDRAKEAVGAGKGDLIVYGKGSDDHKATVVGDTVGDPFKDTSGPALNILIKLISIVSVVFAGLIVAYGDILGGILGI